jgi:hypothetical protein
MILAVHALFVSLMGSLVTILDHYHIEELTSIHSKYQKDLVHMASHQGR